MKVLYVTQFSPWNPKYGAALRSSGILRGLAQNHALHIALAASDPGQVESFLRQAPQQCGSLHVLRKGDPGRAPFRASFLELLAAIQPEVVWYFTKYALREVGFPTGIPTVLDLDDLPWRKLWLMGKYQSGRQKLLTLAKVAPSWVEDSWLARRASTVLLTNPDEVRRVRGRRPGLSLANGFDFPEQLTIVPRHSQRVLFFGSLFYYPNLDGIRWFCQEVWPEVRRVIPGAQLDIVGLYEGGVQALQETPGVTLHGFVEDLDVLIRDSAFLIVPLRIGSGTRIKILEAWSKGLPVVSTTLGAEGLGATPGENALVADNAAQLAAACTQLLQSPTLGAHLAENAYRTARRRFGWDWIYPQLEQILRSARSDER